MPYRLNRAPRVVSSYDTGIDFVAIHGNNHLLCTNTRVFLHPDNSVSLRMTDHTASLDIITWYHNFTLRVCGGSGSRQVRTRLGLWLPNSTRCRGWQIFDPQTSRWESLPRRTVWFGNPPPAPRHEPRVPSNTPIVASTVMEDECAELWETVNAPLNFLREWVERAETLAGNTPPSEAELIDVQQSLDGTQPAAMLDYATPRSVWVPSESRRIGILTVAARVIEWCRDNHGELAGRGTIHHALTALGINATTLTSVDWTILETLLLENPDAMTELTERIEAGEADA